MGRSKKTRRCPRCGSTDVLRQDSFDDGVDLYVCTDCDHEFEVGAHNARRRHGDYESDDDFEQESVEDGRER